MNLDECIPRYKPEDLIMLKIWNTENLLEKTKTKLQDTSMFSLFRHGENFL